MGIEQILAEMKRIDSSAKYYALTLLGLENGNIETSAFSHWVGSTKGRPQREIRKASLVRPDVMARAWEAIKQPYVIVNHELHMIVFSAIGGHALVERSLAECCFSDMIEPQAVVSEGIGFRCVASVPAPTLNHAPTKKLRMQVLERDSYRCRICGERPADNIHITLHVHHIRPWGGGFGGQTVIENLITVCHTCHAGIGHEYNPNLFELIGIEHTAGMVVDGAAEEYRRGVELYRKLMQELSAQLK